MARDRLDVHLGEDLRCRRGVEAAAAQKPPSAYLRDLLIQDLYTQAWLATGEPPPMVRLRTYVKFMLSTIEHELARQETAPGVAVAGVEELPLDVEVVETEEEPPESGFRYFPIARLSSLDAPALRAEAERAGSGAEAYQIVIWGDDGAPDPDHAEAVYLPTEQRLGIAWAGPATWARVPDLERGIAMWLNDPDAWEARG